LSSQQELDLRSKQKRYQHFEMATQLVGSGPRRIVSYLPSLCRVVKHFRAFSSYDERHPGNTPIEITISNPSSTVDERLGPFGPGDKRFPMPGMVGPSQHVKCKIEKLSFVPQEDPDILTQELPSERHMAMMDQAHAISRQIGAEDQLSDDTLPVTVFDQLECVAIECPSLVQKDFYDLFPEKVFSGDKMTVITISQRTDNDMAMWSPEIEEERETLLENFVKGASEICESLKEAGYWADFIEPSSGRPYFGAYTHATLFETDERYRHFGFEIKDLGCCKVISHHLWGTKAYIGCLFTDAPLDHPVLMDLTMNR